MRIKLGVPMPLYEIADAVKGRLISNTQAKVTHITTDSREILPGDLFFPLQGKQYDGESFIDNALKKGGFVISSRSLKAHILVSPPLTALLSLAEYYNKKLPYIIYRIGITGSVGKTTTKEFLKILLSDSYRVHASEGNLNSEIGLPLSILTAPPDSEILLMEMGMNHPGEISRLSKCLAPDIAIITNVGTAHIGNLGSREAIAKAKLEVKDGMNGGKLILPSDEPLLADEANSIFVSLLKKDADFSIHREDLDKLTILKDGHFYCNTSFAFKETHLMECLLFAASAAIIAGVSSQKLSQAISLISDDNIRQRLFFAKKYYFYTDFYNASFESILASFETVKNIGITEKKHLLLGDVLELGNMAEKMHYEIGKNIPKDVFSSIFLFGSFAEHTQKGAADAGFYKEAIHINRDLTNPIATANQICNFCNDGDLILMKASRAVKLERVLEYFID